jgi:hypothetical protein
MLPFWNRFSSELHMLFGLLDDVGDISSALVIILATLKVAAGFVHKRTRRATVPCTLSHPRRRRRRHRRPPCVIQHSTARVVQPFQTKTQAPDHRKTA